MNTNSLSRKLAGYGIVRGVVEALTSIRGIALASILGAEGFGTWLLFRIILRYSTFAGLGLQRGIEFCVASEPNPKEWGKAGTALTLAIFVPISIVLLAAGLLTELGPLSTSLAAVGAVALVNRLWILAASYLRGLGNLRDLVKLEILVGILQAVLVVVLAWLFGVQGAFAGMLLGFLTGSVLFFRQVPLPPRWSTRRSTTMIRVGFPVTLSSLLLASFSLSDRLVVGALLGVEALGVYGFAIAAAEIGQNLANVTRTVVLPDIYQQANRKEKTSAVPHDMLRVLKGFAFFVPVGCGFFALALEPAVESLLPQFVEAVPITRTYLFVAALHGLSILATLGVVARGRQSLLPLFSLAGVVLNVAISGTLIVLGGELVTVAYAAMLTHSLHAVAVITIALEDGESTYGVTPAVSVILPVFWCLAALAIVLHLLAPVSVSDYLRAAVLFAICVSPLAAGLFSDALKVRRSR